ncbi:outer membrane beta-barrel protein [Thiotrichales bacterium 19S3-7]|nr:outer membrane beta-barrel protein [Thiotrichales bacterium 19S3-7]MCF6800755.1 outer membrane beta-barrel protein [Thiotrichales bacterium 19S3-11]
MSNFKKSIIAILTGITATTASQVALAQSNDTQNTTATTSSDNFSHWQIRARGIWVVPIVSSTEIQAAPVKVESISNAVVPEIDINYFFTPHISTELILATTKNSVNGSNGTDLGSVWLLPPTLTVLYHFMPDYWISPYAGAGINYTFFYNVKSGDVSDIHYDNTFGFALQAGVDFNINSHWSFNLDVKKLFINTDAHVDLGSGMNQTLNVTINPWIFGAGIGYKF